MNFYDFKDQFNEWFLTPYFNQSTILAKNRLKNILDDNNKPLYLSYPALKGLTCWSLNNDSYLGERVNCNTITGSLELDKVTLKKKEVLEFKKALSVILSKVDPFKDNLSDINWENSLKVHLHLKNAIYPEWLAFLREYKMEGSQHLIKLNKLHRPKLPEDIDNVALKSLYYNATNINFSQRINRNDTNNISRLIPKSPLTGFTSSIITGNYLKLLHFDSKDMWFKVTDKWGISRNKILWILFLNQSVNSGSFRGFIDGDSPGITELKKNIHTSALDDKTTKNDRTWFFILICLLEPTPSNPNINIKDIAPSLTYPSVLSDLKALILKTVDYFTERSTSNIYRVNLGSVIREANLKNCDVEMLNWTVSQRLSWNKSNKVTKELYLLKKWIDNHQKKQSTPGYYDSLLKDGYEGPLIQLLNRLNKTFPSFLQLKNVELLPYASTTWVGLMLNRRNLLQSLTNYNLHLSDNWRTL